MIRFKNFSFFIVLLASLLPAANFAMETPATPTENSYTPATTAIAWDLHGVVLQRPWSAWMKGFFGIFWAAQNKWELTKAAPGCITAGVNMRKTAPDGETIIHNLASQYPALSPHKDRVIEVLNSHNPDPKVVGIIKKLSEQGYEQRIASNISPKSLEIISGKHAKLFAHFKDSQETAIIKDAQGNPVKKPELGFFDGLQAKTNPKNTLFVDDSKRNVEASCNANIAGLEAIHFTNAKQLKKELKKRNILKDGSHKPKDK